MSVAYIIYKSIYMCVIYVYIICLAVCLPVNDTVAGQRVNIRIPNTANATYYTVLQKH